MKLNLDRTDTKFSPAVCIRDFLPFFLTLNQRTLKVEKTKHSFWGSHLDNVASLCPLPVFATESLSGEVRKVTYFRDTGEEYKRGNI